MPALDPYKTALFIYNQEDLLDLKMFTKDFQTCNNYKWQIVKRANWQSAAINALMSHVVLQLKEF